MCANKESSWRWQPRRQLWLWQRRSMWDSCQDWRGPFESMTGQSAVEVFKLGAAMPKGGAPVEKKSDDSPNFPKTPSLPLTGLREVECCFFFPSSLRRSSSWQAAGSGPGLMFVCGIVSSLSVGANPENGFNYVRRTFESLFAASGRARTDGALTCETDKPLFCIITRPFIPVIYSGEAGIY